MVFNLYHTTKNIKNGKILKRPFDDGLVNLMVDVTKYLVQETNAIIGYTQSDEITLILHTPDWKSAIYNDGKKQKILSKLTAKCVNYFNERRPFWLPNHNKTAIFDCRIYQVPSLQDACLQLLWRENDAVKNSISMLAQANFAHNRLQNLNGNQLQELMMVEKGLNWNDLPSPNKRGSYVKRTVISTPFTVEELKTLPPKHNAHKNPNMVVERSVIELMDMPIFSKLKNKVGVVFYNEQPELYE